MAIIVVEGPDRVGKSTQIKRMMKHLKDKPIQWLHYSSIPGLSSSEQTEFFKKTFDHMFETILNDNKAHWILDRSHLGEVVYQPIYRPEENSSYVWYLEGKHKIAERKDVILFVIHDSSFENLKRDDGDSYTTDLEECKKEVERFKGAFENTSIAKKYLIDIAGKDANQVEEEIKRILIQSFIIPKSIVPLKSTIYSTPSNK